MMMPKRLKGGHVVNHLGASCSGKQGRSAYSLEVPAVGLASGEFSHHRERRCVALHSRALMLSNLFETGRLPQSQRIDFPFASLRPRVLVMSLSLSPVLVTRSNGSRALGIPCSG
jgi:hypothetical protein